MIHTENTPLKLSRQLLWLLTDLNLAMGVGILGLLIASIVDGAWVARSLGVPPADLSSSLVGGMRGIMAIGLAGVAVTHYALGRLRAIVATVTNGDPFVAENAVRLQQIAWALLGIELLRIGVGLVVGMVSAVSVVFKLGWRFSPTPWLAILLLFVLARVFDQGARMRADLDGTV